jgi:hypothetical protein
MNQVTNTEVDLSGYDKALVKARVLGQILRGSGFKPSEILYGVHEDGAVVGIQYANQNAFFVFKKDVSTTFEALREQNHQIEQIKIPQKQLINLIETEISENDMALLMAVFAKVGFETSHQGYKNWLLFRYGGVPASIQ